MQFTRSTFLYAGILCACLTAFAIEPQPARAQASATPNVSVSFNRTPIQTALRDLFTQAHLNYSIEPTVQGSVTASLRHVPFQAALNAILAANRPQLVYTVINGVYQIRPRSSAYSRPRAAPRPYPYRARAMHRGAQGLIGSADVISIPLDYADAGLLLREAFGGGPIIARMPLGRPGRSGTGMGSPRMGAGMGSGFGTGMNMGGNTVHSIMPGVR